MELQIPDEGWTSVYRIAVWAEDESKGRDYARRIACICRAQGVFPIMEWHAEPEQRFASWPTRVFLALPGVDGLNAAEHLRALSPNCGLIWCSDLNFSLHAFRLRADYFLMEPVTDEKLQEALAVWFGRENEMPKGQSDGVRER